jgi:signal transduction histidine kinase
VHRIVREIRTRLHYKIILPFLVLTIVVALSGYAIAFYLIAEAQQRRFDNEVADVARVANLAVVDRERANLQFLIEIVFAQENQAASAPAVNRAISDGDDEGLHRALEPFFLRGITLPMVNIDRMIAFDQHGTSLVDLERNTPGLENTEDQSYQTNTRLPMGNLSIVQDTLNGVDEKGRDKYAAMVWLPNEAYPEGRLYFVTVAPVKVSVKGDEDKIVGGIMVAMVVDKLAEEIRDYADRAEEVAASEQAQITFYEENERAYVSTFDPHNGLDILDFYDDEELRDTVRRQRERDGLVFDTAKIGDQKYQFGYTLLEIRGKSIGFLSAALPHSRMHGSEGEGLRILLIGITLILMLGIIAVGLFISRQITVPLGELVSTAREVTEGNFQRRSNVRSLDEIGVLSVAFNRMTGHLLHLFGQVLAESGQRAAIVDSIGDGIVVCDNDGVIQMINRATCRFLGLEGQERAVFPGRLSDLPLVRVTEPVFGNQADDIYNLGEHLVKVLMSPVITVRGNHLGNVYVLQDRTAEVKTDIARTGFIRTVSHEMRTPLTSLRGNVDMLLHGLAGPLQGEQVSMVETMSTQTSNMTRLLNNMIAIAGFDSGTTKIELEPIALKRVVEEAIWPFRKAIKSRNISLKLDIPPDMPLVEADRIHLRLIIQQLIENARVYTDEGGNITVRATTEGTVARIDVIDTGCGIPPDLIDRVFERFVRGEESNDRPDRGIGLGLAIVKNLVEQHGGQVWVQSKPGQGSTFSFTLRCAYETGNPGDKQIAEAA